VWFEGVWTIRSNSKDPFALQGDSGSLIVSEDGERAAGLLFALSDSEGNVGLMFPMNVVTAAFGGISPVGKHGL
jgi:hypothetical protein